MERSSDGQMTSDNGDPLGADHVRLILADNTPTRRTFPEIKRTKAQSRTGRTFVRVGPQRCRENKGNRYEPSGAKPSRSHQPPLNPGVMEYAHDNLLNFVTEKDSKHVAAPDSRDLVLLLPLSVMCVLYAGWSTAICCQAWGPPAFHVRPAHTSNNGPPGRA